MSRCQAESIYPAGQIDRCQLTGQHRGNWHFVEHSDGQTTHWWGDRSRTRAWEDLMWQFKAGWRAAVGNDDFPLYERGPKFNGMARNA